ncbi:MAG TPA: 4-hydroxy-tetrahydrodipicolinate synthase [Tepidisphaeraceae bacterium]|nr:4-hydroxy-tetrahydrodipicolinate synthase [Tepidisphaeraceae bacterium]
MAMKVDWLRGCATALVTPFQADGSIDEPSLRKLVDYQISGGVKLLIPCGTTGESATTSEAEDQRIIKIVLQQANGRAKVIAGTGSNSTSSAVQYTRDAARLGCDGALVVAPYYNKPTQSGMLAHFKAVADAAPNLPIVLYNVPGRTGCNMFPATTLQLANEVRNVAAVKEASGDIGQIGTILRNRPEHFAVLSGDDAMTFPLMALGAEGVVSVASNEAPRLMSELCELCLQGEWQNARQLHFKLQPLMEANFIESSPGPVKAALEMIGVIQEHLRLPLVPVSDPTRVRLETLLKELGLYNSV